MLTKNEAKRIFDSYLGIFKKAVIEPSDKIKFKTIYPELQDAYVTGSRENLLKFGQYVLLNFGRQKYKFILAYDIIFSFFEEGNISEGAAESDPMGWFDTAIDLYIVLWMANTPKNKMLEPSLSYFIQNRKLQGKTTIVLSENINIAEVLENFDSDERINLQNIVKLSKDLNIKPVSVSEDLESNAISISEESEIVEKGSSNDLSSKFGVLKSSKVKKAWKRS
jgi:hypothetical protein